MLHRYAPAIFLGLLLWAAQGWLEPRLASACSCGGEIVIFPAKGATRVPTNARIVTNLGTIDDDDFVLFDGQRQTIATERRDFGERGVVITPTALLDPQTEYELWWCWEGSCEAQLITFTTGDGPDDEPPPLPVVLDREQDRLPPGPCGPARWISFSIEHQGLLVASFGDPPVFDPETFEGKLADMTTGAGVTLGSGGCTFGWPKGKTRTVRFGVYDAAGNFSGWTEPTTETLTGYNCAIGPRSGPWPLATPLALAALGWLRTRRRRRARPLQSPASR